MDSPTSAKPMRIDSASTKPLPSKKRVSRACDECRLHKARCDGSKTCETCFRYDRGQTCSRNLPRPQVLLTSSQSAVTIFFLPSARDPPQGSGYWSTVWPRQGNVSATCRNSCQTTTLRSLMRPWLLSPISSLPSPLLRLPSSLRPLRIPLRLRA